MSDRGPEGNGGGPMRGYVALLAVIVAIALFYWLASAFVEWNKTQTCVGFGKRNCAAPIRLDEEPIDLGRDQARG